MSFWSSKKNKEANNSILVGAILTFLGICGIAIGASTKEEIRQYDEIQGGIGVWKDLKEQNRELYYECLRELESK